MNEKKLVPNLRFEDFDGEYEEYYISDLFSSLKGSGLSKEVLDETGMNKCILYGELYTTYSEIIKEIKSRTDATCNCLSKKGDILIPASTTTKGIDLVTASVVCEDNVYLGGDITILRNKDNSIINNSYFAYYFTHGLIKEVSRLTQGSTIIHLYWKDFKKIVINLPSLDEQEKIVSLFSIIDKKIELLEKKCQLYQEMKKYLMQQIFTQELRFPNNNSEWEWLNFEDIFKSVSTKKYQIKSTEINTTGTYEVIDQGQKDIAGYHNDKSKLFNEVPIIIFGDHTTIVKYRNKPFIVGADGVKLLSPKIDVDMKYMYYALNYFNIKPEGYKRHFSIIKKIDLPVPTLKEQNQISSFFSAFDEKINFIQTQIEYMKEYKKGLLQKMFI